MALMMMLLLYYLSILRSSWPHYDGASSLQEEIVAAIQNDVISVCSPSLDSARERRSQGGSNICVPEAPGHAPRAPTLCAALLAPGASDARRQWAVVQPCRFS
eukprot:5647362-Pleurochrysis_carterae.AAC.4